MGQVETKKKAKKRKQKKRTKHQSVTESDLRHSLNLCVKSRAHADDLTSTWRKCNQRINQCNSL